MTEPFIKFPKIPRLYRDIVITEKIDGTNAQIFVPEDPNEPILAGCRTRWITPEDDNHGFAKWVKTNEVELRKLGRGHHFGEWWGQGINRGYGLEEKRFSLFNVTKWGDESKRPACCHVVPVIGEGRFEDWTVESALVSLAWGGSYAAPGFMNPEGIVIFHTAGGGMFKVTLKDDDRGKE